MNEHDRKAQDPPAAAAGLPEPPVEPPLLEQVRELFGGRLRWLSILIAVVSLAFIVFAVVSAVCFFRAEDVKEMIAWAGGFFLGLIAATAGRLWFWLIWHRNAVVREVRRVERQLALLASQLKTSR